MHPPAPALLSRLDLSSLRYWLLSPFLLWLTVTLLVSTQLSSDDKLTWTPHTPLEGWCNGGYTEAQDPDLPKQGSFPLEKCCNLLGACAQPQEGLKGTRGRRVHSGWQRVPLSAWALLLELHSAQPIIQDTLPEKQAFRMLPLPQRLQLHSPEVPSQACLTLVAQCSQLPSSCSCEDPSPSGEHDAPIPMDYLLNLL